MKTIIVPTDFSKNAYCALYYATQLFARDTCKFILINSFENQVTNLTSRIDIGKTEVVVNELYETTEVRCEELKQKIIRDTNNKSHTYHTIATSLSLTRAINKLVVKEAADYVVMGGKGSTGAHNILMGSNTLLMIRKIKNVSLLVIPYPFNFKPIKKIAFATGFKRPYSKKELEPLVAISSLYNADIKIVHVNKKEKMSELQRANVHELFELLGSAHPENTWLYDNDNSYDAIGSYVQKEHIDILAMISYKHNAIVRLFREATLKKIAKHATIPFLILPKID